MSPKKPETKPDASSWITKGRAELKAQTPAQRGFIQDPEEVKKPKAEPTRKRFTVNLEIELIEQARRTVANTLGLTLTGLVEEALRKELAKRIKERGSDFPENNLAPKKGRPVTFK